MAGIFRVFLICAILGGCAGTSEVSSLSTIGGGAREPEKPAPTAAAAKPSESSGLGGIWENFSSAFSSGTQPASQAPDGASATDKPTLDANEALRLVNDFRAKKGLHPLSLDPQATAAAEALSLDMAKHDHMSHYGPNGADVGKRLTAAGYAYRLAAENVGVGQRSLADMIDGWKKSPPHSRNLLLADAKHMGIAFEYKPDSKYKSFWTLVVASP